MELWTEKFRPKKFEDVVGQKDIVAGVKGMVEKGDIPHMLFHGPAGVGKTTLAYIVGRELFGENFKSNFMELNASDERGIQVIREKVKGFAKVRPLGADFKIIFLDEADYLTPDAQASLRRIMEVYHKTTRFILCCNYINKIISPIQSRCKVFSFGKLGSDEIMNLVGIIAPNTDSGAIIKKCKGDLRQVINELQANSAGVVSDDVEVDYGNIVNSLREKDFKVFRGLVNSCGSVDRRRMLVELRDYIVEERAGKPEWLLSIMKADERLIMGVDEDLVFDGLFFEITKDIS